MDRLSDQARPEPRERSWANAPHVDLPPRGLYHQPPSANFDRMLKA